MRVEVMRCSNRWQLTSLRWLKRLMEYSAVNENCVYLVIEHQEAVCHIFQNMEILGKIKNFPDAVIYQAT